MNVLIRNTIATVLCGMILLGHSAAWLHVATCQGHHGGDPQDVLVAGVSEVAVFDGQAAASAVSQVHACCGHHHARCGSGEPLIPSQSEESSGGVPSDAPPHDSDRCATCQYLATAGIAVATQSVVQTATVLPERLAVTDSPLSESLATSFPRLRGPPVS